MLVHGTPPVRSPSPPGTSSISSITSAFSKVLRIISLFSRFLWLLDSSRLHRVRCPRTQRARSIGQVHSQTAPLLFLFAALHMYLNRPSSPATYRVLPCAAKTAWASTLTPVRTAPLPFRCWQDRLSDKINTVVVDRPSPKPKKRPVVAGLFPL